MVVEAAAASTRDVPLRRRCTQATGKQRLGQPFSQARCRAMAFAHHTVNGLAAGPPSHRAAPPRGHLGKMSKQQPSNSQALLSSLGLPKIFFYKRKKSKADGSLPLHAEVS